MKNSKVALSKSDIVFNIINYSLLTIILLMVIYPLWFVLIASVSDPNKVALGQALLFPSGFTMEGYRKALEYKDIWVGFKNSGIYTVLGAFISTAFTISAGYVMSRKDLVGKKIILLYIMIPMFFNGGLIPTYLVVREVGMIDTIWALIIPNAVWVYNLLICSTFFKTTIPDELLEACQIDGGNNMFFFFKIVIPLSQAIIAVMVLFYAVAQWNGFFDALIYLRKRELFPLQIHLRNILLMNSVDSSVMGDASTMDARQRLADMLKYVLIVVSCVPMFLLYPFVQKYFVTGVMIGAVKG